MIQFKAKARNLRTGSGRMLIESPRHAGSVSTFDARVKEGFEYLVTIEQVLPKLPSGWLWNGYEIRSSGGSNAMWLAEEDGGIEWKGMELIPAWAIKAFIEAGLLKL